MRRVCEGRYKCEWITNYIAEFNYFTVALVLFLAGLGFPIPEDIPLIYGEVMASKGSRTLGSMVSSALCLFLWEITASTGLVVGLAIALKPPALSRKC